MLFVLVSILSVASLGHSSIIRRQDPGMQQIPTTAKADNTFNNGAPQLNAEPDQVTDTPPAVYGARSVDLPFGRLYHGNMMFFSAGELNTPTGIKDEWINTPANPTQNGIDSANQSACGIPDNAFSGSKVAIHPYFLKYADLSRYCMQDVCISYWKEDGSSDMMLKVTDICSTDPNDPTHCATPADIKVDRGKAQVMEGLMNPPDTTAHPEVMGDVFPDKVWWFFMKCWADGLAQPAYQGNNWFTDPPLANNLKWAQGTQMQQYQNNQVAYAAKGWPTYPNGAYNPQRDDTTSPPISDWAPGDATPAWSPVAGGKGWGQPNSAGSESLPASNVGPASSVSLSATSAIATGTEAPGSGQGSGQGEDQGQGQGQNEGAGQGIGQGAGQGGSATTSTVMPTPFSNSTAAAPTPVPALEKAVVQADDEQDECDEL